MQISKEDLMGTLARLQNGYTFTENGAITPSTSGSELIDQFGKAASFRERALSDVFSDMDALWAKHKENALKFVFYLRLITRTTKLPNGKTTEKIQKGQGCKDEVFKRLLWFAVNQPEQLYSNIYLLPIVGSWKDIWALLEYSSIHGVDINKSVIYALLASAMQSEEQIDLIKKFMPRILTKSNIKSERALIRTIHAREFADFLGITPKQYNKLKSSGKAHEFQQLICDKQFDKLEWNKIPGIALGKIVSSKLLANHNLEDNYIQWLSNQDAIKFNGTPYDLLQRLIKSQKHIISAMSLLGHHAKDIPAIVKATTDLQFDNLIATAQTDGKITENILCALDTSGSMGSGMIGSVKPIDVCISLGVYFSTLNQGHFHNKVAMFNRTSTIKELSGTFTDKIKSIPLDAMGDTNFLSVIQMLVDYRRQHPEVPIEEYPTTLLVVSDMQFNPAIDRRMPFSRRRRYKETISVETNYESMKHMLAEVFPREFVQRMKFVWWNVNGSHNNMPATMNDGGCYFFSGFDGAIISMLLNEDVKEKESRKHKTMEEMVQEALNQEVLSLVQL